MISEIDTCLTRCRRDSLSIIFNYFAISQSLIFFCINGLAVFSRVLNLEPARRLDFFFGHWSLIDRIFLGLFGHNDRKKFPIFLAFFLLYIVFETSNNCLRKHNFIAEFVRRDRNDKNCF